MHSQSNSNLKRLSKDVVDKDSTLEPKILQFGGGNFIRAFINGMIHDLNVKSDFQGSCIVVKPTKNGDYDALRRQDGLFNVATNGIKSGEIVSENKLVSSVHSVIHPYKEWDAFLKTAELESIRFITSNTTEAGIKTSDKDHFNYSPPHEFPAKVTRWLFHRFKYFDGAMSAGCVFLPCELIENNGEALHDCILYYVAKWELDEDFETWINECNIFCNTLVDRIVTGFPKDRSEVIFESLGYVDDLLVSAEPYHLFVISSSVDFQDELPFQKTNLNVVFTTNLTPYRELKVRILNGAHTCMVPIAYLYGIETVREAMENAHLGKFIKDLLSDEICSTLNYSEDRLEEYVADVLDRFRNPFIHHFLINIALNSISKFKTRVLPSLIQYVKIHKKLPKRIIFSFAALIWFYRGKRENEEIPLNDDQGTIEFFLEGWNKFESQESSMKEMVFEILDKSEFWLIDLNEISGLENSLTNHLTSFSENGYSHEFLNFIKDSN